MAISTNIFEKCTPAIGTDLNRCGSVTMCNLRVPTKAELPSIFADGSGNFRLMSALFYQDFEAKACQAVQNGLYDLITANKVNMSLRMPSEFLGKGIYMIRPFMMIGRKNLINNYYWAVSGGTTNGNNWQVDVESQSGIPADTRWFMTDQRVFIEGRTSGGTTTQTAWRVVSATIVSGKVRVILASENSNSWLAPSQLQNPVTGVLQRGTPNKSNYESWCEQPPGLNTNSLTPSWIETTRNALCNDELYEKYHQALRDDNPYWEKFGDIESVELNKQISEDWQRNFVNQWWFGKKLTGQNLDSWQTQLEQITVASSSSLYLPNEGRCVGYRANAEGVFEQLVQCGRYFDLQGRVLNLQEFFEALYQIIRVREGQGRTVTRIDVLTDSWYKKQFQQAMVRYFNTTSEGLIRFTKELKGHNDLGFNFDVYELDYPSVELAVISHKFFDDRVAARRAAGLGEYRDLWVVDFADIITGILASDRVVNSTGSLQEIAKVDSTYRCVMAVPKLTTTLTSTTWTVFVQCPGSHMLLANLNPAVPEHRGKSGNQSNQYGYYDDAYPI